MTSGSADCDDLAFPSTRSGSGEAEQADLLALPEVQIRHARHTGYKADQPQDRLTPHSGLVGPAASTWGWRILLSLTDAALTMVRASEVGHLERRGREGY